MPYNQLVTTNSYQNKNYRQLKNIIEYFRHFSQLSYAQLISV